MYYSNNNLNNLNILRSIAILLVVLSHIPIINLPEIYAKYSLGLIGVFIFFVHTSFVLMLSLKRLNIKNNFAIIILTFYIQRIFRIYPLSIFSVLFFFYIYFLETNSFNLYKFICNIFLIQNLTLNNSLPEVLWSLPYEVQMYIFLPFIFLFTKYKDSKKKIIILWTFFIIFLLFLKYYKFQYLYDIFHFFPIFFSGIFGFAFYNKNNKKLNCKYIFLYIFLIIIIYPILVNAKISENLLGVIFFTPLGWLIAKSKDSSNNFINAVCKKIANYSYSIYLFHLLFINIFFKYLNFPMNNLLKLLLFFLTTLIFSHIVYNFFERPLIKIGKKLSTTYNAV